jgi:steroid delta-isomerase-like uncharacterized protein
MTEQEATARRAIELFNASDYDGMAALTTNDYVYEEIGSGRRTTGIDEFLAVVKAWKQGLPNATGTITNALSAGNQVMLEIVWEGDHTGELPTPMGDIPATGRHTNTKAVEVVEFEGSKIKAARHYLDLVTFMAQLGLGMPAPATA